jgi:hypothetical protein
VNAKLFKLLSIDFIQINKAQAIIQTDPVKETTPALPTSPPKMTENSDLIIQVQDSLLLPIQKQMKKSRVALSNG